MAVLILLPPSETKARARRGSPMRPSELSFPGLAPTREAVIDAVIAASARDDALEVLRVPASLGAEVAANAGLREMPARPAMEVYTGVLYDALDHASLSPGAKRRAGNRLVMSSTLYGALRPGDRIAPYRASMQADLPGLGTPGARWRAALDDVLSPAAGPGLIVDCRSATYAATWTPPPALAPRWVAVQVPGVSHMAKHTRGLVARALCESAPDPRRPAGLLPLLDAGFDCALTRPERPGRPWVLAVTAR